MKKLLFLSLVLISASVSALSPTGPEVAALKFNQWYISQLMQEKDPLTDYSGLKPYVAVSTISAIKASNSADGETEDVPNADMFIKAQDFGEDWQHIEVVSSDYDPVCRQVYVSFGVKQSHTVIDCMVMEEGSWKILSVAGQAILRNVSLK